MFEWKVVKEVKGTDKNFAPKNACLLFKLVISFLQRCCSLELEAAGGGVHADVSVMRLPVGRPQKDRFGDKCRDFGVAWWEVVPTGVVFPGGADEVEGNVGEARRR